MYFRTNLTIKLAGVVNLKSAWFGKVHDKLTVVQVPHSSFKTFEKKNLMTTKHVLEEALWIQDKQRGEMIRD